MNVNVNLQFPSAEGTTQPSVGREPYAIYALRNVILRKNTLRNVILRDNAPRDNAAGTKHPNLGHEPYGLNISDL